MSTGYTRNDVANNISDQNIIEAVDLDGEFDAIQAAFAAVTGHSHDGTVGEGGPILSLGPAQEVVATSTALRPKSDNAIDLGTINLEFRDLFIDGVAYIDDLRADTVNIDGGVIDATVIGGVTPAAGTFTTLTVTSGTVGGASFATTTGTQTLTNKTISADSNTISGIAASSFVVTDASGNVDGAALQKAIPAGDVVGTTDTQTLANKTINLASNTLVASSAQIAAAVSDETGTGSLVFSNSPTFTGTPVAPTPLTGDNTQQIATTAFVQSSLTGSGLGDMLKAVYDINNDGAVNAADKWTTPRTVTIGSTGKLIDGQADTAWTLSEIGVGAGTLTLNTSGIATGSQTFGANQGTNGTFTVNVPGTDLSVTSNALVGPVITSSTGNNIEIPVASATVSGVITTGVQTFAGTKTFGVLSSTSLSTGALSTTGITLNGTAITSTAAEINFLSGVSSNVQTQLNAKQATDSDLTALAGLATTGIIVRTGTGTAATRTLAAGTGLAIADGTGVAGNPTISATLATQAQAEAGTDNTTLMTPLRTEQAIAASTPVTAQAVGTYGLFALSTASTALVAGTSYAGSSLRAWGFYITDLTPGAVGGNSIVGAAPSGTWRCMQGVASVGSSFSVSIFLRIS